MRTCRSFIFANFSDDSVYPLIKRVKKGCESSLLLRETYHTAHAAGMVAKVSQKPFYMPIGSAQVLSYILRCFNRK